ncbi:MAG: hypothetical protein HGB04_09115 [Chlorobiaceae bacterium]|nr:hypothetical protein [Chlorobiaceae bacterium]
MKKLFLFLAGVLVLSGTAQAKTKQRSAPSSDLPVITMGMGAVASGPMCPMMDSMPVMIQVLKLQQKLDEGATGAERKEIIADKAKLIGVLDAASSQMKDMPCMSGQMPCMETAKPNAPQQKGAACCPQQKQTPPCLPAPKK